jgi:hypothetical protein
MQEIARLADWLLTSAFKLVLLNFANVSSTSGREADSRLERSVWGKWVGGGVC